MLICHRCEIRLTWATFRGFWVLHMVRLSRFRKTSVTFRFWNPESQKTDRKIQGNGFGFDFFFPSLLLVLVAACLWVSDLFMNPFGRVMCRETFGRRWPFRRLFHIHAAASVHVPQGWRRCGPPQSARKTHSCLSSPVNLLTDCRISLFKG